MLNRQYKIRKAGAFQEIFGFNPMQTWVETPMTRHERQDKVNLALEHLAMMLSVQTHLAGREFGHPPTAKGVKKMFWQAHKIARSWGYQVRGSWTEYLDVNPLQWLVLGQSIHAATVAAAKKP
jgi:hypothetical protein